MFDLVEDRSHPHYIFELSEPTLDIGRFLVCRRRFVALWFFSPVMFTFFLPVFFSCPIAGIQSMIAMAYDQRSRGREIGGI